MANPSKKGGKNGKRTGINGLGRIGKLSSGFARDVLIAVVSGILVYVVIESVLRKLF
jgi:hypothetical protein